VRRHFTCWLGGASGWWDQYDEFSLMNIPVVVTNAVATYDYAWQNAAADTTLFDPATGMPLGFNVGLNQGWWSLTGESLSYTDTIVGNGAMLLGNGWDSSYVTAATDALSIAGLFFKGKAAKVLGRVGDAVSIWNDPSPLNITTNLLGLFEGFEAPMAVTGAFNDYLTWGVNNSSPGPHTVYDSTELQPALPVQDECAAFGWGPC
jgi:hypothetical protein